MIIVYITNPNKKTAKKIAKYLLEKGLIACGNIFPVESIYNWKDKIVEEKEYVLVAKTIEVKFDIIQIEVSKIHPYKIPCILKINCKSNKSFSKWIKEEIVNHKI